MFSVDDENIFVNNQNINRYSTVLKLLCVVLYMYIYLYEHVFAVQSMILYALAEASRQ